MKYLRVYPPDRHDGGRDLSFWIEGAYFPGGEAFIFFRVLHVIGDGLGTMSVGGQCGVSAIEGPPFTALHSRDAERPWPKQFEQELLGEDWDRIREGLEVKLCESPNGEETFILCRSDQRREKEKAIHERFEKRIESGLRGIEESCRKRNYKLGVIERRVGRLLGRNNRAAGLFEVEVKSGSKGRTQLKWRKVEAWRRWAELSEGCYLLRTNVKDWTAEELWKAYIQLTEAEAAFRIQKSDLRIRPIWHQRRNRVEAHILVCFLAYVLWKTLAQRCQRAGLGDEPRKVLDELKAIQLVDVVLPTKKGVELRRRCVSRPTQHQAILLQRLGLRLPSNLKMAEM